MFFLAIDLHVSREYTAVFMHNESRILHHLLGIALLVLCAGGGTAHACVVGTGMAATCTEAALVACLPGGGFSTAP